MRVTERVKGDQVRGSWGFTRVCQFPFLLLPASVPPLPFISPPPFLSSHSPPLSPRVLGAWRCGLCIVMHRCPSPAPQHPLQVPLKDLSALSGDFKDEESVPPGLRGGAPLICTLVCTACPCVCACVYACSCRNVHISLSCFTGWRAGLASAAPGPAPSWWHRDWSPWTAQPCSVHVTLQLTGGAWDPVGCSRLLFLRFSRTMGRPGGGGLGQVREEVRAQSPPPGRCSASSQCRGPLTSRGRGE